MISHRLNQFLKDVSLTLQDKEKLSPYIHMNLTYNSCLTIHFGKKIRPMYSL